MFLWMYSISELENCYAEVACTHSMPAETYFIPCFITKMPRDEYLSQRKMISVCVYSGCLTRSQRRRVGEGITRERDKYVVANECNVKFFTSLCCFLALMLSKFAQ